MLFDITLAREVRDHGLKNGCTRVLARIGLRLQIQGALPSKGPTLIISNHAGMPDTLILFASANRDDLHHVALSTYRDILQKYGLNEHTKFIPIYRNVSYRDFIPKLIWGKTYKYFQRNKHNAGILNKESIARARGELEAGNAVILFPQGSVGRPVTKTKWKAGVGHLVKQIERDDIQIVFTSIKGTAKADIFRFVNILHPLFRDKKVSIQYSQPLTLSDLKIDKSKPGKEIALDIEREYCHFAKSLE